MSRYPQFDRSELALRDLFERENLVQLNDCPRAGSLLLKFQHPELPDLATAIRTARKNERPVILMMGAHVIKQGMSRYLIDLMERGMVTHLATNGAGIIHDFELSRIGATSEDVARYIKAGDFGMWAQTGELNQIVSDSMAKGEGIGEAVGRHIVEHGYAHQDLSVAAAGWRCGVPVTSHVGIGADIIHAHPNCQGQAWGAASYTDFLIFTAAVARLEGGVFLNVGSAVTGPEVYLKALSMARNVARQRDERIAQFTTAVFDLVELPANFREGSPPKSHPQYYYRPWKTILLRTVADGGQSHYFQGDHRETIPALHALLQ